MRLLALFALLLSLGCGGTPVAPDPEPVPEPAPEAAPTVLKMRTPGTPTPESLLVAGEQQLPAGWSVYQFSKGKTPTRYVLTDADELTAAADKSASALRIEMAIDPQRYPRLAWSWKIEAPVDGDVRVKARDDCAARVLLMFKYDPEIANFRERMKFRAAAIKAGRMPPYRVLCYAWTAIRYPTRIVASPHASEIAIVVQRSGGRDAGKWVDEQVDYVADYRKAFGAEPPPIESVAVMTDTDNTLSTASAAYRALRFAPRSR